MPPRKRKKNNDVDRLAKLAAAAGIDFDKLLEEVPLTEIGPEAVERASLEAESTLFYIQGKGKGFQQKNCGYCKGLFLHTYFNVAYCSDNCRSNALAEQGIIWNPDRRPDHERWNIKNKGYVPKIIGPEATEALIESGNFHGEVPEQFLPTYDEVQEDISGLDYNRRN